MSIVLSYGYPWSRVAGTCWHWVRGGYTLDKLAVHHRATHRHKQHRLTGSSYIKEGLLLWYGRGLSVTSLKQTRRMYRCFTNYAVDPVPATGSNATKLY